MRDVQLEALEIFLRLCAAGVLGAVIGFERRVHHKAIGIAGMMLISIGSTTYITCCSRDLADVDPASVSRRLQDFLSGIGFLGGAVIFKSGFDVKGIKAAGRDLDHRRSDWRSPPPIGRSAWSPARSPPSSFSLPTAFRTRSARRNRSRDRFTKSARRCCAGVPGRWIVAWRLSGAGGVADIPGEVPHRRRAAAAIPERRGHGRGARLASWLQGPGRRSFHRRISNRRPPRECPCRARGTAGSRSIPAVQARGRLPVCAASRALEPPPGADDPRSEELAYGTRFASVMPERAPRSRETRKPPLASASSSLAADALAEQLSRCGASGQPGKGVLK